MWQTKLGIDIEFKRSFQGRAHLTGTALMRPCAQGLHKQVTPGGLYLELPRNTAYLDLHKPVEICSIEGEKQNQK